VETYVAYAGNDGAVYRIGSLVGEPKQLAACCIFWLALVMSAFVDKEFSRKTRFLLLTVILLTLWFTASTSGWIAALCCLSLAIPLIGRWNGHRSVVPTCIGLGLLVLLSSALITGNVGERLADSGFWQAVKVRLVDRLSEGTDVISSSLSDGPEQLTIELLSERPHLAIFGVGQGGVSFYIAEMTGGSPIILSPNNGVLALVSSIGIVGIGLLLFVFFRLACLVTPGRGGAPNAGAMALVGIVAWLQVCIFPQPYLISCACGFLLSAGFAKQMQGHVKLVGLPRQRPTITAPSAECRV